MFILKNPAALAFALMSWAMSGGAARTAARAEASQKSPRAQRSSVQDKMEDAGEADAGVLCGLGHRHSNAQRGSNVPGLDHRGNATVAAEPGIEYQDGDSARPWHRIAEAETEQRLTLPKAAEFHCGLGGLCIAPNPRADDHSGNGARAQGTPAYRNPWESTPTGRSWLPVPMLGSRPSGTRQFPRLSNDRRLSSTATQAPP